jgi:glycerol 2-dehydrogenase (NADP+)
VRHTLTSHLNSSTALAYGNEKEVGEGIKDSGIAREELWVTTKLDNPWHKRVEEGINSSLKSLGLDYVDLYLMVRPQYTWCHRCGYI